MKTIAICSTKNEADVIEAFVRLNAKICDTFFFADDSTDQTRAILECLSREGYDLRLLPRAIKEGEHNQPQASQVYLAHVAESTHPDWIFFLDADEIIVAADRIQIEQELATLGTGEYLVAPWRTYVPASLGYFEADSPLCECFRPRIEDAPPYSKVSIPGGLARAVSTTAGNHSVTSLIGEQLRPVTAQSYFLAHFPVRSPEQIVVKNLIATHNLASRPDARRGEGSHVRPVLESIRRCGYGMRLDDLRAIADGYALDPATSQPRTVEPPVRDPRFACPWKYRDLARIDVIERLDTELERYAAELRRAREGTLSSDLISVRLRLHDLGPAA